MSVAKRTRQRQTDGTLAASTPPAKRAKFSQDQPSSLAYLVDERQRAGKTIAAKLTNGVDSRRIDRVDESNAAITDQTAADDEIRDSEDASSVVSSSSEDQDEDLSSSEGDAAVGVKSASAGAVDDDQDSEEANGDEVGGIEPAAGKDVPDADLADAADHGAGNADEVELGEDRSMINGVKLPSARGTRPDQPNHTVPPADDGVDQGPSFGEMLQITHPDIIDVFTSLGDQDMQSKTLSTAARVKVPAAPSGASLSTVLSQALRTNDKELLESCLQTREPASIKSTIERLPSPLVASLMQRLAERLHKRPGRAGPLMVWIQWVLVAHGGYLAGQPQVVKQLKPLRHVVRERASSLQPLMVLKGKLDLLGAQVELRRSIRRQRASADESDNEEDDIVYVEDGAASPTESSDDDADGETEARVVGGGPSKMKAILARSQANVAHDQGIEDDEHLINGVDEDVEMDSVADDEEDDAVNGNGLVDDEAEESEQESLSSEDESSGSDEESDADEQDDDSASSDGDEDVSVAPSRPLKRASLIRKGRA